MSGFKRRDFLKVMGGVAAASTLGIGPLVSAPARAQSMTFQPEPGARLRVLRWRPSVSGDEDVWLANTRKFTQRTGVEVKVESDLWQDVRPKVTFSASLGRGPDIIIGFFDDPHQDPEALVDLSDLANYLGGKYGGWYDVCYKFGLLGFQWLALPIGCVGNCIVYRESHVRAAGFSKFPTDTNGFLELCRALKARRTPPGFALGNAVGDANMWTHWLLWTFGGRMVDGSNNVVLNSPETINALGYGSKLYETFAPGTLWWNDAANDRAFLNGEISLTANDISIYHAARNSKNPKLNELAEDIQHANMPVGPIGWPTELSLFTQAMVFKYSRYPNAAQEYLRFMCEQEQYQPWLNAANGAVTQPLKGYESNPVWTADPKRIPYRDAMKVMSYNGYAGKLGVASASAMADFIIVNMVAQVASGRSPPNAAAAFAQKRAERYYHSLASRTNGA